MEMRYGTEILKLKDYNRLSVISWELGVIGWEMSVGRCQFAVESCQLVVGSLQLGWAEMIFELQCFLCLTSHISYLISNISVESFQIGLEKLNIKILKSLD
jgi:hypothetical protein